MDIISMNISRRRFLFVTTSIATTGLVSLADTKVDSQNTISFPPKTANIIRLAVISDLNSQYGSTHYEPEVIEAIALIPQSQPVLVICAGDMIAAQKRSLTQAQIEAMWSAFELSIAIPLRTKNIPLAITIGNHDGSGAIVQGEMPFKLDREIAAKYWRDPNHTPNLNYIDNTAFPFYYSFKQNEIFYLVWDASTHRIDDSQLRWIESNLASEKAQNAKMRLVIGHLPLYPVGVGRDKPGEILENPQAKLNLLEQYKVHTYISGHHHAYFLGQIGNIKLLHTGALGTGPRKLLNSDRDPIKTLTLIDINKSSQTTTYNTYDITNKKPLNPNTLPPQIGPVVGL